MTAEGAIANSLPFSAATFELGSYGYILPLQTLPGPRFADLPTGLNVALVSVFACLRDPSVWTEPDQFLPGRWLEASVPEEQRRRMAQAFMPFLAGPRNCIGQKFAMQVLLDPVSDVS